jgi:hypothetical protein
VGLGEQPLWRVGRRHHHGPVQQYTGAYRGQNTRLRRRRDVEHDDDQPRLDHHDYHPRRRGSHHHDDRPRRWRGSHHLPRYASSPYKTAIEALATAGIITGFGDGTFHPNDPVTRQQFAKMIVKTLGLTVTGAEVCPFTDVALQQGSDPFYPSKHVAVCAAQGITVGKTPTSFAPNDDITRQQLITMVARAAKLAEAPPTWAPSFSPGRSL